MLIKKKLEFKDLEKVTCQKKLRNDSESAKKFNPEKFAPFLTKIFSKNLLTTVNF